MEDDHHRRWPLQAGEQLIMYNQITSAHQRPNALLLARNNNMIQMFQVDP